MMITCLTLLESDADKRLFTEIFEKYHEKMEQCAIHILGNQHDAEDAVQNAFVQIIRHFEKIYNIPCEELPFWIISIVKNESLMILRKRKKMVDLESVDGPVWQIEGTLDYRELVRMFQRLPETYRAVLEMKLIAGYPDREIAEHLGISETAVSSRASRGRALLRDIIKKEGMHL